MWSQRNGRLSTITKVKVLSPEIRDIALGQGLFVSEAGTAACFKGECVSNVLGSEAMVGNRIIYIGTWESHIVLKLVASTLRRRARADYNAATYDGWLKARSSLS